MPPRIVLDHIAIACATLAEGIDWVEERLGVRVPLGGKHPIMNTHNAVMSLGDGVYLEIVAADPEAGPAERSRWFGLDDPEVKSRLAAEGPFLAAWIARSDDVARTVELARTDLGKVYTMRRGELVWQIAIRDDGSVPMGGLHPIVIEWPPGPHVSTRMADLGCRLERLVLRPTVAGSLETALQAIGAEGLAEIRPPKRGGDLVEAVLRRPDGHHVSLAGGMPTRGRGCE
ncbi:MAG: VOC family protein [Hyphomicrobiaceae bacterium]